MMYHLMILIYNSTIYIENSWKFYDIYSSIQLNVSFDLNQKFYEAKKQQCKI